MHDWRWLAELGGEDEGEQLGFVTDFCQRNDTGGDEESIH
jgi:hypothetical protein